LVWWSTFRHLDEVPEVVTIRGSIITLQLAFYRLNYN